LNHPWDLDLVNLRGIVQCKDSFNLGTQMIHSPRAHLDGLHCSGSHFWFVLNFGRQLRLPIFSWPQCPRQ